MSRGGVEKNSRYRHAAFLFSGGTLGGRGGGVLKKICAHFFSGPKTLKLPDLYICSLDLEGARRIFIKVTIDVSADVGCICALEEGDPRFVRAIV